MTLTPSPPAARKVQVELDEIAQRIQNASTANPDKVSRRMAQGLLVRDAAGMLDALMGALNEIVRLRQNMGMLEAMLHDHATVVAVALERAGGSITVPKDWFEAFTPTGGWDIDQADDNVVIRALSEEELAARRAELEKEGRDAQETQAPGG